MNDKLTLNEHERITQIYAVYIRNANKKRVKKACRMWQNTLTKQREKRNRRNTAQFKYFKYEPRPSIMGFALRGEKLNYKSVAKEVSKPLFFWLLKSSGHQSLPCLFDSRFL